LHQVLATFWFGLIIFLLLKFLNEGKILEWSFRIGSE
jgi:hypothetical protein